MWIGRVRSEFEARVLQVVEFVGGTRFVLSKVTREYVAGKNPFECLFTSGKPAANVSRVSFAVVCKYDLKGLPNRRCSLIALVHHDR